MLIYPSINPVAFHIGSWPIHWYGLMYLMGFASAWLLALWRARQPSSGWNAAQVGDLIFYTALGVIVGGRLGYVLFYDFPRFLTHPFSLFALWEGGMSFHGGLLGVIVATGWLSYRYHRCWADITDFVVPLVPLGLAAGRLGNFINGELWGRVTTMSWGMVFPQAGPWPRHPSQVYEFLLEGVLLFVILWWYSSKRRPRFAVSALFLLCYGAFRFFIEFFRQPDPQLGYLAWGWLTMGQLLSFPMVLLGCIALWYTYQYKESASW